MTEYRNATYKPQISQRTRTTIRRAFTNLGRPQDTRFLENLTRIHDFNSMIYACAYLIILDGLREDITIEDPESISKSKLFETLVDKMDGEEDEDEKESSNNKYRLILLFQVYIMIITIRLNVPREELIRREGQSSESGRYLDFES